MKSRVFLLLGLALIATLALVNAQVATPPPPVVAPQPYTGCSHLEARSKATVIDSLKKKISAAADAAAQTETEAEAEAAVESTVGATPLGPAWVKQFLGSNSLDSLNPTWGPKAKAFVAALRAAGATVTINAANRPIQRSYLMYYAWQIAKGGIAPSKVPAYPGVSIDWTNGGKTASAVTLARQMCAAYGVAWNSARQQVGRPGNSRHNYGAAVDMNIQGYINKNVKNPQGKLVKLTNVAALRNLGRAYGVIYYTGEDMHWSDTGR